ncbi:MAG: D-glycerate dehydrogenase [Nitrospira sp.]|nr:D-glycerate dehydrogenase [Nitrospira sp.]
MDRPTLYITRLLPQAVMDAIPQHYRVLADSTDRPATAHELGHGFSQADAVICTLADRIDASILSQAIKLKIVANYAVGYNNIDLSTAAQRGFIVTNTPDVLTDATADLTWALLLGVARRVAEGDALVRTGHWTGWAPTQMLGTDVTGKTLGIVGMGRIGQAVAYRATGRMSVLYTGRHAVSSPPGVSWTRQPLDAVLTRSDYLSLHVPLTDTTRHLIGQRELALMEVHGLSHQHLARTSHRLSRSALLAALEAGTIAGAGLDVYDTRTSGFPCSVLAAECGPSSPSSVLPSSRRVSDEAYLS